MHGGPVGGISLVDHRFLRLLAARGHDVYLYEQPGGGRSDLLPFEQYSIQRSVADLAAFVDDLRAGPVDVLGFSAGAVVLTRALADPDVSTRIRRAVIAEPGPIDGPRAETLRWALYADKAPPRWSRDKRSELTELLRSVARERLTHAQALARYDAFVATVRAEDHHAALELLAGARDQVFTCLQPAVRHALAHLGGPELGSGLLERVMRELNARTDIGGCRWSIDGLRDLITIQLARMTQHPAWATLRASTHSPNLINFKITQLKFNAS